jgi:murein DD-endopeptidase MepM/ murein hydrolase activator NlpD
MELLQFILKKGKMKSMKKALFSLVIVGGVLLMASGCTQRTAKTATSSLNINTSVNSSISENVNVVINANMNSSSVVNSVPLQNGFVTPLDRPTERITKKPFGIYITPATSPVQPERFTGYHTGADFEILPGEENTAVVVKAFCPGRVVYKQWVSGYGGVFIQQCSVDNQIVTVLYGHLKLSSITAGVGDSLSTGDAIGELGQGASHDTDGERKHLHFSIHKGNSINVKGYVSQRSDLNGWLDPQKYL